MKNSFVLENHIDVKYKKILNHDKIGIDNPDKYNPTRLRYLDRIEKIILIVKKEFPNPDKIKIGDFACAQGNISLILAEMGYDVSAIDINPIFIEYSKTKYERGKIEWIIGNIENLDLPSSVFDIALAGEIIEHCAYPEDIIKNILRHLRPNGILIITSPNASRILTRLPSFKRLSTKEKRKIFEKVQFGEDGQNHLFLFKMQELKYVLPKEVKIIEQGYLGGIFLVNTFSRPFLKLIPLQIIKRAIRQLSKIPGVNKKLFNNLYIVLRKKYAINQ